MVTPALSVVIPTSGRSTLERTLRSVRLQRPASEVEIICVGDTHRDLFRDALASAPALCAQYDAQYFGWDGEWNAWGHPQRQFGQAQATGEWLVFSQDDDIFTRGAFGRIHAGLAGPVAPRLFQVQTWQVGRIWREPVLAVGNVDAGCLVTPNDPARLGRWGVRYNADFDMIAATCALWERREQWVPACIALGRPSPAADWTHDAYSA